MGTLLIVIDNVIRNGLFEFLLGQVFMAVQLFPLKTAVEAFDFPVICRFALAGKGLPDIIFPQ